MRQLLAILRASETHAQDFRRAGPEAPPLRKKNNQATASQPTCAKLPISILGLSLVILFISMLLVASEGKLLTVLG